MRYAIGIDLGGTNLRAALVSEDGEIHAQVREKTPTKEGPEATAELMRKMIERLTRDHGRRSVEGVGIGSPGPLSRTEKKIFNTANLPGFENFPLGRRVEELSGKRVFFDNDAKCAAYGEGYFGEARALRNFILMTFGTGVGGGIVVDGRMMYGKSDGACEVGHFTLYPDGEPCPCGNRGCFERYVSASAIVRRSEAALGEEVKAYEVFERAKRGDTKAQVFLREIARDIAIGAASLVNLFDPDAVVFGGGIFSDGGAPVLEWIREQMRGRCFESSQRGLKIVASSLGGNAGVLGAASLVFSSPT